jgi:endoglucanase
MKPVLLLVAVLVIPHALRAKASESWPFWSSYESQFVSQDGRVIDPDRNSITTSEGQGYAMFFALVANDSSTFERIRAWTENNLARSDLAQNLPAWSWGQSKDGSWKVLDQNSAADADLWIAYSLIQAGSLWKNVTYSRAGKSLLGQIAKNEVAELPGDGSVLMPGRTELFSTADRWVLNESYSPLPLLVAAAHAEPEGPWRELAAALPGWLERASPSGFAMDWISYSKAGFSAIANPGDNSRGACGSYDAIRVYLWASITDPETPGVEKILRIFSPMAKLVARGERPPEVVSPSGEILSKNSPVGFSAALIPFLLSVGDKAGADAELEQVKAQFDKKTGLFGSRPRYYDQNLALFALGWQEQRYRFAADGALKVQWKK